MGALAGVQSFGGMCLFGACPRADGTHELRRSAPNVETFTIVRAGKPIVSVLAIEAQEPDVLLKKVSAAVDQGSDDRIALESEKFRSFDL